MNPKPAAADVIALRWGNEEIWKWNRTKPWRLGCNFLPSSAANQWEMWSKEHFDPETIDRELGWLAGLGMNSLRVFLHDLLWTGDGEDFLERIENYLSIADKHGIATLFVFFDSCWYPLPRKEWMPPVEAGVHNSAWLQSPGVSTLRDPEAFARLEPYVRGVVERFAQDSRVEGWDLWNEPDNSNSASYGARDIREGKADVVLPLLIQAFGWVRACHPCQPLTSGVWQWTPECTLASSALQDFQVKASDFISFHIYDKPGQVEKAIRFLRLYERPLVCTEYMARTVDCTFEGILPLFKTEGVAAYNWGGVAGRSQTYFPWDSWQSPYQPEPPLWHHDIFRSDGSPYRREETDLIRTLAMPPRGTGI